MDKEQDDTHNAAIREFFASLPSEEEHQKMLDERDAYVRELEHEEAAEASNV